MQAECTERKEKHSDADHLIDEFENQQEKIRKPILEA